MSSVAVPAIRCAVKSASRSSATWVTRATSGRAKLRESWASARIGATGRGAAAAQAATRIRARARSRITDSARRAAQQVRLPEHQPDPELVILILLLGEAVALILADQVP